MRPSFRWGAAALIASVAVVAGGAPPAAAAAPVKSAALAPSKGTAAQAAAPAPTSWRDLGDAFESSQLLEGAARVSALESLDGSVARALHGDMDDDRRLAARFLAARLDFERGDYTHAVSGFSAAADAATRSRFADDAAFAGIEAL